MSADRVGVRTGDAAPPAVAPSRPGNGLARPSSGWDPEEVAVCDLCGLVSREPVPSVCPACGGGYG